MINRRGFLSSFAGVAGAASALGLSPKSVAFLVEAGLNPGAAQEPPKLPDRALYDSNEEAYWTEMRKQFLIPTDEVYLNNGTVGSCPMPVLRAVFDGYYDTEKMAQSDPEDYPIWGYGSWNEFRDPLAEFVGCTRDEIALVRNATEANSYVANGLDLQPGDEVLMTDQEHPGGEQPWNLRAKRYGIVVKKVKLPAPVPNAAAVLNLFNDAVTPRTRVIFFSHITTATGVVLPAKELCALARSKGILSAVDGAHVIGMMKLNLHEIGCDMYSSSPHKWLMAPKGTGFLFLRDEVMDRIERRHRQMADYIHKEIVQRGAVSWTSPDPALRCGIASVNVAPAQISEIESWMWKTKKIRIRGGAPSKIRLSTPYYLLHKDVDRFLAAFDEYKKGKAAA